MSVKQWFYVCNNNKLGPVSTEDLKELARTGQLLPTDVIWREGLADWLVASKAKGLFEDPVVQPPPLPVQNMSAASPLAMSQQMASSIDSGTALPPELDFPPLLSDGSAFRREPEASWPLVFGIIAMVLALFLFLNPIQVFFLKKDSNVQELFPSWFLDYLNYESILLVLVGLLLGSTGLALVTKKAIARVLAYIFSTLYIVITIIGLVTVMSVMDELNTDHLEPTQISILKTHMAGGLVLPSILGFGVPIFSIIWFSQKSTIDEMLRWGMPREI